MFRSLHARLWLSYLLLTLVVLGLISVSLLIYLIRNPTPIRQGYLQLETTAALFQRMVKQAKDNSLARITALADRMDANWDTRIIILDAAGEVLVDTRAATVKPIPALGVPDALKRKNSINRQFRDSSGQFWLYAARPLEGGYYLVTTAPRPAVTFREIFRDEFLGPLVRAGFVAAALSLLLAWLVVRWISKPLERISLAARAVAAGQYQPIPLEGPSEVQELAQSFNEMSRQVQASQESQRQFVANVSHDLKTPLTSIQGFAQAILDGTASTAQDLHKAADIIYSEAARMYLMVQDLLDLARLDSGIADLRLAPVDMTAMLQNIVTRLSPQAGEAGIELTTELSPTPSIQGDRDRLDQVFANLIDNALKFTPTGGAVTLRSRTVKDQVEIAITDNGPGIPEEDLSRIFERFFQTDRSRSGNRRGAGLGLAIAHEIVLAHKGSITAFNNIDQKNGKNAGMLPIRDPRGSTFVVKLPLILGTG